MKWKKNSLPHIIYDQYCNNTKKNHNGNRFSGSSYFLAHLSDHENIAFAVFITALFFSIPFFFLGFFYGIFSVMGIHLLIALTLASLDTYSTRKFRVRINLKNTMDKMFDKDHHEKKGWY